MSALLVAHLATPVASAAVYDVRIEGTLDQFFGSPFGLSGPTPIDFTITLDTDAAPVYVLPPTDFSTPLYGFQDVAVSMTPYALGSAVFTAAQLNDNVPQSGVPAHKVWMDVELVDGAVGRVWMDFFIPPFATFSLMRGSCGAPCILEDTASIDDFGGGGFAFGQGFFATVTERGATPSLAVDVAYAIPGQQALVHATGAAPGATIQFAASTRQGAGPCPPGLGGACIGLLSAVRLGAATATSRGDAWLLVNVPPTLAVGTTLHFQAFDGAGGIASPVDSVTTTAN
jgi:hypothetical protein